ncbi:NADH-quinone oxidoreductase subunit N [Flavobacterium magnum]|uniref:NADH-quinone oxidoreductase subunit N n=1 Tax=Flavobacterium magnum TaxID=2162713 RepID=A0A2S0RFT1_9FLAO|nr:NADH-quinone oxidoreductase subunit N [Flavobacterium magnum]AWA29572.1 NADH-quinone oxidoreductase subunit N [Flavobacterium magnum]
MNLLIAITGLGVLCLMFEIFNLRKALVPLVILGLLGALALDISEYDAIITSNNNMVTVNNFSVAFSGLFIILTIFLVALSHNFYENHQTKISDYIAIKVFMLAGCVALVSFQNLAMFFLGIEVLSISLYILAASNRLNLKSNEAGMKYFLMGSFASGILLFGICLIYGAIGSFDMATIQEAGMSAAVEEWFYIGIILVSIGLLFKIAAVPFHFWAPDVYQGAPALTTATMSTIGKVTAMAAFFKLATVMNVNLPEAQSVIVVVSMLSMTVGNIMALRQANVKRMLAFSGVSHAGFLLMTLLGNENPPATLLYYSAAYALAGIAAFSVILYVCKNRENEDIVNFNGLGKSNPLLAAILTGALLSMAGIPVFAGFFAKLMLFGQVISAGHIALVIVAVVNSIISVGYYFKLILAMYTKEANEERPGTPVLLYATAIISLSLNIAMGLFPSVVLDLLA